MKIMHIINNQCYFCQNDLILLNYIGKPKKCLTCNVFYYLYFFDQSKIRDIYYILDHELYTSFMHLLNTNTVMFCYKTQPFRIIQDLKNLKIIHPKDVINYIIRLERLKYLQ